jgi:hypothetical protein
MKGMIDLAHRSRGIHDVSLRASSLPQTHQLAAPARTLRVKSMMDSAGLSTSQSRWLLVIRMLLSVFRHPALCSVRYGEQHVNRFRRGRTLDLRICTVVSDGRTHLSSTSPLRPKSTCITSLLSARVAALSKPLFGSAHHDKSLFELSFRVSRSLITILYRRERRQLPRVKISKSRTFAPVLLPVAAILSQTVRRYGPS